MPTWGWLVIAAVVLVAVIAFVVYNRATSSKRRSQRLREHYGPEYDRALNETGDARAAESALLEREKRVKKLDIVTLSPQACAMYTDHWHRVQKGFVDNPTGALSEADMLVNQVMRERGYPVDDFDERAADIAVDHPDVVQNYRAAHSIFQSQERGQVDTERQREAFVHYRALFDRLLANETDTPKEARA